PINEGQQPTRDVNGPSWNRERIGLRLVYNLKAELPTRVLDNGHQPVADLAQVGLGFRQGVQANLLLDQFCHLRALFEVSRRRRAEQLPTGRGSEHSDGQRGERHREFQLFRHMVRKWLLSHTLRYRGVMSCYGFSI